MTKIEDFELDTCLTFDKPMTKKDIIFESLSQEELHQLIIDPTYIQKLQKKIKSGRTRELLSLLGKEMEYEGGGFWETVVGEYGWTYLESLYCMGFLDKHLIVAMLDENGCFNEYLADILHEDAYEF